MVIVDTSVWVTHLRRGSRHLQELLLDAKVVCHPFVIGELACGNLKNRGEFLSLLQSLPMTPTVVLNELLYFIARHRLIGKGLGFVDTNLLASTHLSGIPLWTFDKRLRSVATELELAYR